MDKHVANRLILIGNGFDLAHDLKTSYNDFILWYMTQCFAEADKNKTYDDPIVTITRNSAMELRVGSNLGLDNYVRNFYNCGFEGIEGDMIPTGAGLNQHHTNPFKVKIHSPFFKRLLFKCSGTSWVEIENEYYTFLKDILNSDKKEKRLEVLTELHTRFAYIIERLQKYLNDIAIPAPIAGYKDIFNSHILEKDLAEVSRKIVGSKLPDETLVLNFNYTSTIEAYLTPKKSIAPKAVFIQITYMGSLGKQIIQLFLVSVMNWIVIMREWSLKKVKGFWHISSPFGTSKHPTTTT